MIKATFNAGWFLQMVLLKSNMPRLDIIFAHITLYLFTAYECAKRQYMSIIKD